MKTASFIIASLCALLFFSCTKELKITPEVITTNQLTITTDTTAYLVVTLDSLKITPVIIESKPEGHAFSYEWRTWSTSTGGNFTVLSRERNLRVKMTLAPRNNYNLEYIVKDEVTGLSYMKLLRLEVQSPFYEGWLVTNNKAGQGYLSFLRVDDVVYMSPAQDINNKTYDSGFFASAAADYFSNIYQISYVAKNGVSRFDANSFIEMAGVNATFDVPMTFTSKAYHGFNGYYSDQFVIDRGDIYGSSSIAGTAKFSQRLPGNYNAFPYIFPLGGGGGIIGVYDNNAKSFFTITSGTKTIAPLTGTGGYDLDNVGKTMIAADFGPDGEFYCLMKDEATGSYYIYSLKAKADDNAYAGIRQMLNAPDIANATGITCSSLLPHMYYASGNKIYLYDINANQASLVYTFPQGYVVKDLKMFKYPYKQIDLQSNPLYNRRLVVGIDNGGNGEVYYLDLTNLGQIQNNTYSKKFTGFGQITHLNYRSQY